MKIEIEIDETKYGLFCKPEHVAQLHTLINQLAGRLWAEAHYNPYNDYVKQYARELETIVDQIKYLLRQKAT